MSKKRVAISAAVTIYVVVSMVALGLLYANKDSINQTNGVAGTVSTKVVAHNIQAVEVGRLVNMERQKNNLPLLATNVLLDSSAQAKCNAMTAIGSWSHDLPDGTKPWKFILDTGYSYTFAGENLAYGYTTEKALVQGWMNSTGHRKNILDSNFKDVGYGVCKYKSTVKSGETLVVQHLAAR